MSLHYCLDFPNTCEEEKNNPHMPTQSVSPPAHVMWVFMSGHLQHPASPGGFVKASELGGGQRVEPEGQTQVWPRRP